MRLLFAVVAVVFAGVNIAGLLLAYFAVLLMLKMLLCPGRGQLPLHPPRLPHTHV
jgi:hypothetical protein